jgi:hypothetical protein
MFGEPPKQNVFSPLEKGEHTELDTSAFLDEKGIKTYQSMIGALQWMITIGRFDILMAVKSMSSFRAATCNTSWSLRKAKKNLRVSF